MRNLGQPFAMTAAVASAAVVLVGCSPSAQDSDNPIRTQEAPVTESNGSTSDSQAPESSQSPDAPGTDAAAQFVGTWVDPDGLGYLTFNEDGSVRGSDACNGIGSTYSVNGGATTVEPFATTMMACSEGWSQWLLQVTTVEVSDNGSEMVVYGRDGSEAGTLVPGEEPQGNGR